MVAANGQNISYFLFSFWISRAYLCHEVTMTSLDQSLAKLWVWHFIPVKRWKKVFVSSVFMTSCFDFLEISKNFGCNLYSHIQANFAAGPELQGFNLGNSATLWAESDRNFLGVRRESWDEGIMPLWQVVQNGFWCVPWLTSLSDKAKISVQRTRSGQSWPTASIREAMCQTAKPKRDQLLARTVHVQIVEFVQELQLGMPKVAQHSIFGNLMNGERCGCTPTWNYPGDHACLMTWGNVTTRKILWWALLCFAHQGARYGFLHSFLQALVVLYERAFLILPKLAQAGICRHVARLTPLNWTDCWQIQTGPANTFFKPTSFVLGNLAARYSSMVFHPL